MPEYTREVETEPLPSAEDDFVMCCLCGTARRRSTPLAAHAPLDCLQAQLDVLAKQQAWLVREIARNERFVFCSRDAVFRAARKLLATLVRSGPFLTAREGAILLALVVLVLYLYRLADALPG